MIRVKKLINYDEAVRRHLSGNHIKIAVLDSGISMHPDLIENLVYSMNFTEDFTGQENDECGHGTHIAGIIAGNGKLSHGRLSGIAPKAELLSIKVLDQKGNGYVRSLQKALEWIADNGRKEEIEIVNLSISVRKVSNEDDLEKIMYLLDDISDQGMLVVTASGNYGPDYDSLSRLAESAKVLTVGCFDRDMLGNRNACMNYSGKGKKYGLINKPDILLPGTEIYSCSFNANHYGEKRKPYGYCAKTGTSMSAAIATGICALLLEQKKRTPYQIKKKLLDCGDRVYLGNEKLTGVIPNLNKVLLLKGQND